MLNQIWEIDKKFLRILRVDGDTIFIIDVHCPKALPIRISSFEMFQQIESGIATLAKDPFFEVSEQLTNNEKMIAQKRLSSLGNLVSDSQMFYKKYRNKLISQQSKQSKTSAVSLRKWIRLYWQRGSTLCALKPAYKNCGGKGKERCYTPPKTSISQAPVLTDEIKKLFDRVIDTHLMTKKKKGPAYAHRALKYLYSKANPEAKLENMPTFSQFYYYYKKRRHVLKTAKLTEKRSTYENDIRAIRGDATSSALGPGSVYEIDATIADIYLVSDKDPTRIIGRPTLYLIVDRFSRMIVGFYIGLETASYVTAMRALSMLFVSWEQYAQELNLDFEKELFPSIGLPDSLTADRAELLSHQSEFLATTLAIRLNYSPPHSPISKAIVERYFRTQQACFKPFAPGVVEGVTIKKRGGHDYRLDAAINLTEFRRLMFSSIIFSNNFHVIRDYTKTEDMPSKLKTIPSHLWNWGISNRTGRLRAPQSERHLLGLLPRQKITIDDRGFKLFGVYYVCQELFESGWLLRGTHKNRPKNLTAAYDPSNAQFIYVITKTRPLEIWTCGLAAHSKRFEGWTFWEVKAVLEEERERNRRHKQDEDKIRGELEAHSERLFAQAMKRKKLCHKKTKSQQIREINDNKRAEINVARQVPIIPNQREEKTSDEKSSRQSVADDNNFDLPDSIDEFFDDED